MKKILHLLLITLLCSPAIAEWPHENISQAVFAKNVENRQPVNIIVDADNSLGKIYFFTNMRNLTGERITHRWSYNNKIMAQISFDIKGQRWRVWSSKNLWHTWLGEWTVDVLNQHSDVLISKTFYYRNKDE
jgi:hypothetical protein